MQSIRKRKDGGRTPSSPSFSLAILGFVLCPHCEVELARDFLGRLICIGCNKSYADPREILLIAEEQINFESFTWKCRFVEDFEALAQEEIFRYEMLIQKVSIAELRADILFYGLEAGALEREDTEASKKMLELAQVKEKMALRELERRESLR